MKVIKNAFVAVIRWLIRQDRWEAQQSADRYREWRSRNIGRMGVFLAVILASALPAVCQSPELVFLLTAGTWPLCESPAAPSFFCAGFVPGNEKYMLMIKSSDSSVVRYSWFVTGTLADGTITTVSGESDRMDNPEGYTVVVVDLGGPITDSSYTVENISVRNEVDRATRANAGK